MYCEMRMKNVTDCVDFSNFDMVDFSNFDMVDFSNFDMV